MWFMDAPYVRYHQKLAVVVSFLTSLVCLRTWPRNFWFAMHFKGHWFSTYLKICRLNLNSSYRNSPGIVRVELRYRVGFFPTIPLLPNMFTYLNFWNVHCLIWNVAAYLNMTNSLIGRLYHWHNMDIMVKIAWFHIIQNLINLK